MRKQKIIRLIIAACSLSSLLAVADDKTLEKIGPFSPDETFVVPVQEQTLIKNKKINNYWLRIKTPAGSINEAPSSPAEIAKRVNDLNGKIEQFKKNAAKFYVLRSKDNRFTLQKVTK